MEQFNVKIVIFSYNREKMLKDILINLEKYNADILIVDDCSDFDVMKYDCYASIYKSEYNGGKEEFYKQWQVALEWLREDKTDKDLIIFMPDDFLSLEVERIIKTASFMNNSMPWLINLINDGRTQCFGSGNVRPTKIGEEDVLKVNFTDCGFFCNTKTLEVLKYWINPIDKERFWRKDNISSGVGQQLTYRLKHVSRIYLPLNSFAFHGDHESKMHKEERIKNPLISKHK